MKCLAGIVTYNPEFNLLKRNVSAIVNQVEHVLIVDNGSANIDDIKSIVDEFDCGLIVLPENLGIAYALNQILKFAGANGYEYFITLDQDSVCSSDIIASYSKYLDLPEAGALTCCILSGKPNFAPQAMECPISEVTECITSGCFCNTAIFESIGGFDCQLFIDCVDNDICINLLVNGYKIYKLNNVVIEHKMGDISIRYIMGRKFIIYAEPPFRHYYISRNWILLSKKYKNRYLGRIIRIWAKSFLLEKHKIKITKATILGIYDGIRGVDGKLRRDI